MPFDNPSARPVVRVRNKAELRLIDGMRARLRTPRQWCKENLAIEGRMCLIGALRAADSGNAFGGYHTKAASRVEARLRVLSGYHSVAGFNDAPNTRHRDIVSLLTRARASFE